MTTKFEQLQAALLAHDAALDALYKSQDAKRSAVIQLMAASTDSEDASTTLRAAETHERETRALLDETRARIEAELRTSKTTD